MKTLINLVVALGFLMGIFLAPAELTEAQPSVPLREINYYPSDFAWERFWANWTEAKPLMDRDLDRVQALGANTVRIFVHPSSTGFPEPTYQFLANFDDALTLIAAHGLKAHVTLFDCWWSWSDIPNSRTWLTRVVRPLRDDPRIALWELQNEVHLELAIVRAWVQSLLPHLRQEAGATPITVSVSDVEWLDDVRDLAGATPPDIYSLHWYPSEFWWTRSFPAVLDRARQLIGSADLMLGEFGYSTYTLSEASQANLYQDVLYWTAQKGIRDLGAWTLNDFPSGTAQCAGIVPPLPTEWYFGLVRLDGSSKPAAGILSAAYHGHDISSPAAVYLINESFEDVGQYLEGVENWRSWDQQWSGNQTFVHDCTTAHSGACSVRVQGVPQLVDGLYGLPVLAVALGRQWTLQGYVRTENLQGWAKLVLSWFNEDREWLDQDTSSTLITATNLSAWTKVAIFSTAPPPGAAYVQVFAQVYTSDPATHVWFDDITLHPNRLFLPSLRRYP
jgi:hypothetical protein